MNVKGTKTEESLKAAFAGESKANRRYLYFANMADIQGAPDMYPGMAKTAREEGFDEIADWFETLAKAERSHANKFTKTLDAYREENA
jgi:rubrerythrin